MNEFRDFSGLYVHIIACTRLFVNNVLRSGLTLNDCCKKACLTHWMPKDRARIHFTEE